MQRSSLYSWSGLIVSSWQYSSQYLWQHSSAQFLNAHVVAVASAALYATAMGTPALAYTNAAVAVWLLSSSWMLPRVAEATLWNNVLVATAMIMLAVLPWFLGRKRSKAVVHEAAG